MSLHLASICNHKPIFYYQFKIKNADQMAIFFYFYSTNSQYWIGLWLWPLEINLKGFFGSNNFFETIVFHYMCIGIKFWILFNSIILIYNFVERLISRWEWRIAVEDVERIETSYLNSHFFSKIYRNLYIIFVYHFSWWQRKFVLL